MVFKLAVFHEATGNHRDEFELVAALANACEQLFAPVVNITFTVKAKSQQDAQIFSLARVVKALQDLEKRLAVEQVVSRCAMLDANCQALAQVELVEVDLLGLGGTLERRRVLEELDKVKCKLLGVLGCQKEALL